jgi:hypothetical protein
VRNPITSLAIPPEFRTRISNGLVLCPAGGQGHMHGGCHSSTFKVVLMSIYREDNQPLACVYSSETTGTWDYVTSTDGACQFFYAGVPATLVSNALHVLCISDGILEFDLDEHSLTVIRGPSITNYIPYDNRQIIEVEDSTVGFAICDCSCFQMWQMNVNGHGATWVPWRTVEFHTILGFPPRIEGQVDMKGYDEDTGAFFIYVNSDVYMVQLKSRQSNRLPWTHHFSSYHPFRSFYTPGDCSSLVFIL